MKRTRQLSALVAALACGCAQAEAPAGAGDALRFERMTCAEFVRARQAPQRNEAVVELTYRALDGRGIDVPVGREEGQLLGTLIDRQCRSVPEVRLGDAVELAVDAVFPPGADLLAWRR
jgi:hypothetical protein